jgi:hypothetical protein
MDTITRPVTEAIDIDTLGDNVIIQGTSDSYIYVRQLFLVADGGDNVITVISDGGEITPPTLSIIPLKDDTGFILENTAPDYPFLFDIKPGSDFVLSLSAGTSVKGHIIYGYRK